MSSPPTIGTSAARANPSGLAECQHQELMIFSDDSRQCKHITLRRALGTFS